MMVALHEGARDTAPYPVDGKTLFETVAGLGVPFGYERSFKVARGRLFDSRFLLSLHRNALGAAPGEVLANVARRLRLPAGVGDSLLGALPRADIVHFGYEAGESGPIYKLYLEFAARLRRHLAAPGRTPRLVHVAVKWRPGPDAAATTARYVCRPGLANDDVLDRLARYFPDRDHETPLRVVRRLATIAAQRNGGEPLLFMEVGETGNPRRSFDVNLYDADLLLRQVAPLLAEIWRHFALNEDDLHRLLEECGGKTLGHVSGGLGREGEEFMTFYFGVEGR